jgi:hypothetical protein
MRLNFETLFFYFLPRFGGFYKAGPILHGELMPRRNDHRLKLFEFLNGKSKIRGDHW